MALNGSNIRIFQNASLPSTWQWREDSQPEKLPGYKDYIQLSDSMSPHCLKWGVDLLKGAGYVTEQNQNDILERLSRLKPGKYLKLDGVSVSWRVKTEKSVTDKVLIDSITNKPKQPDNIGDYWGIEFVGDTVDDDIRLMNAVILSGNMTSRKDQFAKPSDEFHMSHKSHHRIFADGRALSIEVKISDAGIKKFDPLTHRLMRAERDFFRFSSDFSKAFGCTPGTNTRMANIATLFHNLRIAINIQAAHQSGVDQLWSVDTDRTVDLHPISRKEHKLMTSILGPEAIDQITSLFPSNDHGLAVRKPKGHG